MGNMNLNTAVNFTKKKGSDNHSLFYYFYNKLIHYINRICFSYTYNAIIPISSAFVINQYIIIVFGLIKISVYRIFLIDFFLVISQNILIISKALFYK